MENLQQTVHEVVAQVVQQSSSETTEIKNEDRLTDDLNLRSLDLAQIVAILEIKVGVDPFVKHVPITSVRTVDDICKAYQKGLSGDQPEQEQPSLQESQDRAAARRKGYQRRQRQKDGPNG